MTLFDKIAAFLDQRPKAPEPVHGFSRVQIAAAALLVELARQDQDFDDEERNTILRVVREGFGMSPEDAEDLIEQAEHEQAEAWDDWLFREKVKSSFTPDERLKVVAMLWEVAFADGCVDPFEASLIDRIAVSIDIPKAESDDLRIQHEEKQGGC